MGTISRFISVLLKPELVLLNVIIGRELRLALANVTCWGHLNVDYSIHENKNNVGLAS
jgi:hypothetical protein